MKIFFLGTENFDDVMDFRPPLQPEHYVYASHAIRDLASVVLQRAYLVFADSPGFTPIIHQVGQSLGCLDRAILFQSVPESERNTSFPCSYNFDPQDRNKEEALKIMQNVMIGHGDVGRWRRENLGSDEYNAAIFIAPMVMEKWKNRDDGRVLVRRNEYRLLFNSHPRTPVYPVVSAMPHVKPEHENLGNLEEQIMVHLSEREKNMLKYDRLYGVMFKELLFGQN